MIHQLRENSEETTLPPSNVAIIWKYKPAHFQLLISVHTYIQIKPKNNSTEHYSLTLPEMMACRVVAHTGTRI